MWHLCRQIVRLGTSPPNAGHFAQVDFAKFMMLKNRNKIGTVLLVDDLTFCWEIGIVEDDAVATKHLSLPAHRHGMYIVGLRYNERRCDHSILPPLLEEPRFWIAN